MTQSEYQQLVDFLGRQFEAIDRRFEAIDRRFEAIDQRFEAIDQRFEAIDQRFVVVGQRFDAIDQRFEAIDRRFVVVGQRFDAMDRRFDALEGRVDEGFREVLGHLDGIYRRLERLEQEYQAITQTLRRIEALVADERGRRDVLERSVTELKKQVGALQARIDEIERELQG